jgi:putative DNA primase/helicase
MNVDEIKAAAVGKWPGIYEHFGISSNKKHGPCPLCGGTDRYRFDDKDGNGTYFCNQCGAGDGWTMVQKKLEVPFLEAVKIVGDIIGVIPIRSKKKTKRNMKNILNRTWRSALPIKKDDEVMKYLIGRGITLKPDYVRFSQSCYEPDSHKKMCAMLAMVLNPKGKPVTIHRTYLQNGRKANIASPKKLMSHDGDLAGAAIRLLPAENGIVGISEGIETALSASQLFEIPVWSAISCNIMESFIPPKGIREVVICGDNDANFSGQRSAYILAKRLCLEGYKVEVRIPECIGDWAEETTP